MLPERHALEHGTGRILRDARVPDGRYGNPGAGRRPWPPSEVAPASGTERTRTDKGANHGIAG
ncbi:hypothetical protein [Azospirillum doebereinerae]